MKQSTVPNSINDGKVGLDSHFSGIFQEQITL
jgi:hypothetical protein